MENELAAANPQTVQPVDMAVITKYMDSTGLSGNLMPGEKEMFVQMCKGFGLNPFKREIYCTAYGQGQYRKCSIVTGFEVYLKRAERTGKLNGWSVTSSGSVQGGDLTATITIHRKDWAEPFTHTVLYSECVQTNKDGKPNAVWAKQPSYMTKKVAMGQGFRLCFPDELGGMPYTDDEMGIERNAAPAAPEVRNVTPPESAPAEKKENVIAPAAPQAAASTDARLVLEQLLNDHGIELRSKTAEVQPYTLAKNCLDNPASTDEELTAMYNRCVSFLRRKRIPGV